MQEPRFDALARSIATVDRARSPGADACAQETCLTLIRAFGALKLLIDEKLGESGLSRPRLHVLALLNRAGNEVRISDIGAWLGVTRARATRVVDGLERDGLVARAASAADRRTILISITPTGRQRLDTALPHHLAPRPLARTAVVGGKISLHPPVGECPRSDAPCQWWL